MNRFWRVLVLAVVVIGSTADVSEITDRKGVPGWDVDRTVPRDVFTFVRIKYGSNGLRGRYWESWETDMPDAELNLTYRLQEMTSLRVDPVCKALALTDAELFDYPFIYIVEAGYLEFSEDEAQILRRYLMNGGFLMVDDFWGQTQYRNFYRNIKKAFPDREPRELDIGHPIFNCVFPFYEKPQIPAIGWAIRGRSQGITWEYHDGTDEQTPQYKGIFDDKDRMMVMICYNTDSGDGWEREGEDEWFFREFSEKKGYPLAINIIFYAMTH